MKKRLIILFILLLTIGGIGLIIANKIKSTTPIDFTPIGQGGMILRDKNDRVYSAVIMSYEGLQKFKHQYSINLNLKPKDFKDSFYIVGFSDNSWGIEVDGFKRRRKQSYYYLDVADTGVHILAFPPPAGKKYSAYAIIKVSNKLQISHVQVREGVSGGLTKWFQ